MLCLTHEQYQGRLNCKYEISSQFLVKPWQYSAFWCSCVSVIKPLFFVVDCSERVSRATLDLCAAVCSVGWNTLDLSHPQTLIFSNKPHKTKRSISQGDRRQLSPSPCMILSLSHSFSLKYKWAFKVSAHMAMAWRGPLTLTVTWERFFRRTSTKLAID